MKKRRRKKRRGHYHTGIYTSLKTGLTCKYRSGWELSYMQYLDGEPSILTWSYESVIIPYVSNVRTGKIRKYYPDFLLTYVDDTHAIVEIKPSKRVTQANVVKKLNAAREWCSAHQTALVVITENELKVLGLLK